MMSKQPLFETLTGHPIEQFDREIAGLRHHLRSCGSRLTDVHPALSPDVVRDVLADPRLPVSSLRLVRDGQDIPVSKVSSTRTDAIGAQTSLVDSVKLAREMSQGTTVVAGALHRLNPVIGRFARKLSEESGSAIGVNAYITPPSNRGLNLHYDHHDVLVIQIEGDKRWTLAGFGAELPTDAEAWHRIGEQRRTEILSAATGGERLTMTPGDCLYIPRGYLHAAQTLTANSIHLTIAFHPYSVSQLLIELVRHAAARHAWFRRDLREVARHGSDNMTGILGEAMKRLTAAAQSDGTETDLWRILVTDIAKDLPTCTEDVISMADALRDPAHHSYRRNPMSVVQINRTADKYDIVAGEGRVTVSRETGEELEPLLASDDDTDRSKHRDHLSATGHDEVLRGLLRIGAIDVDHKDGHRG